MRTFSVDNAASLATLTGTEPVTVVVISVNEFDLLAFADKTGDYGAFHCTGRILSLGDLTQQVKLGQLGTVSTVQMVLSDFDAEMKLLTDFSLLEGKTIGIYQTFQGNENIDLLFQGVITAPIRWSEGKRELSLSCQSAVRHKQVGYRMTYQTFPGGNPDAFGKPWPIVFGKPAHTKSLLIRKHTAGTLIQAINLLGNIYTPALS